MKIILPIIFCLCAVVSYSQNKQKMAAAAFIKEKGIKLNTVSPPEGFTVYYNCDSMLFMRGNFGDSIKIWTPGSEMPQELDMFKETITNDHFGITQFAKEIQDDGRILVISHWQTNFIFRNDSLYEIVNSKPLSTEDYSKVLSELIKPDTDMELIKKKLDSIQLIAKTQARYLPKLIFTKKMFLNGNTKVKLTKAVNFEEDTIVLEQKWKENGKACYLVRINNTEKNGQETSYAYAIDEDLKFVWWQGCNTR